jgi:hypothetical protein
VSARQRFVLGARLLVVAACLLIAGSLLWSRVDTRHVHRVTAPVGCPQLQIQVASDDASTALDPGHSSAQVTFLSGDPCGTRLVSRYTTATPNRVPGLALLIGGAGIAILGVGLARSHPDETDETIEPLTE